MNGSWRDRALALAAGLAVVGLVRTVLLVRTPAAASLPDGLRAGVLQLQPYRVRAAGGEPGWQGRDRAQGPSQRYTLLPAEGVPLQLELVVRRSRHWDGLEPEPLEQPRLLRLGAKQQVVLGLRSGQPALRTCLVGRGVDGAGAVAAVDRLELIGAVARWRDRLDRPPGVGGQLLRAVAIQGGLRVSERWECLQVTLGRPGGKHGDGALLAAWRRLYPRLQGWGEQWEGVRYSHHQALKAAAWPPGLGRVQTRALAMWKRRPWLSTRMPP